jgi:serine/threonine-protein kinase RsbW
MDLTPTQVRRDSMNRGVHSSLTVPADLAIVAFVRSALACLLTREGWPGEASGKVLLASTEALTNAIEHGSPLGGAIDVEILVTPSTISVRVTDEGRPGASTPRLPVVPPPPSSPRGRGLLIISRLADHVELAPHGSGTAVTAGFQRDAMPLHAAHGGHRAA